MGETVEQITERLSRKNFPEEAFETTKPILAQRKRQIERRRKKRRLSSETIDPEAFVSIAEAADFLGTSQDHVRRHFSRFFVRLGARRIGLKFKHILDPRVGDAA